MRSLSLRSPAKLNLFLQVVNKRPDGYHNLATLFERIDLFDDLKLTLNSTGDIRVFCDHPDVPKDCRNLVFKAAQGDLAVVFYVALAHDKFVHLSPEPHKGQQCLAHRLSSYSHRFDRASCPAALLSQRYLCMVVWRLVPVVGRCRRFSGRINVISRLVSRRRRCIS